MEDGRWKICPTSKINEDNTSVYFSAKTLGFSLFTISGTKKDEVAVTPSPTLAPTITPSTTPAQTPAPIIPAPPAHIPTIRLFIILIAIVSALIVLIGYLLMGKKSRK